MSKIKTIVNKYLPYLLVLLVYLIIALLRFPHITLNITTTVPGGSGDTYQNLWDIWWVNYAVFKLHTSIFSTKLVFWPLGANLVFQTLTPIAAILTAPLQAISIPFSYNALFFLGFASSGLCMFILSYYITSNKYAAFISGIIFTFSATHIAQSVSYLDFMFWGWIALFMYFLLRIIKEKRNYWNVVGLSLSFVLLVFMANIDLGIIALIMGFTTIVAYLIKSKSRKMVLRKSVLYQFFLFFVLAFIIGSWGFIPIIGLFLFKPANPSILVGNGII